MKFNVILPAAGDATRLELPYPKEIHALKKGGVLIDQSLGLLLPYKDQIESITIVLKKGKFAVADYLSKYRHDFYFRFVFFDDHFEDWPGSILSSAPDFGDYNIVLLPDTILEFHAGDNLLSLYSDMLEKHKVGFTVHKPTHEGLGRFGALMVADSGDVTAFCDKPTADEHLYNCYWTSFGFHGGTGEQLLRTMQASLGGYPKNLTSDVAPATARFIKNYQDLGIWSSMSRYLGELHGE